MGTILLAGRERLRRAGAERGQGLVEYALIISVVALGSIAALVFLRDDIKGLFSKAGSSIRVGAALTAGPGGGSGGSGGGSLPTTVTNGIAVGGGGGTATFAPTGTATGPTGYSGQQGLYTDNPPNGTATGDSCGNIVISAGPPQVVTPANWIWVDHEDLPPDQQWGVSGAPGSPFGWACVDPATWNVPPWPTALTFTNGGTARRADTGDVITITFSEALDSNSFCNGWTGSGGSNLVTVGNGGGGNDDFDISVMDPPGGAFCAGPSFGGIDLGSGSFVSGGSTVFNATITLSGSTLTITLGSVFSGGSNVSTGPASVTAIYDPSGNLSDTSGVDMVSNHTVTYTGQVF